MVFWKNVSSYRPSIIFDEADCRLASLQSPLKQKAVIHNTWDWFVNFWNKYGDILTCFRLSPEFIVWKLKWNGWTYYLWAANTIVRVTLVFFHVAFYVNLLLKYCLCAIQYCSHFIISLSVLGYLKSISYDLFERIRGILICNQIH